MYNAIISKVTSKDVHDKADNLEFIIVCNTKVIVTIDTYQIGDLVIFFPSDGQLSKQYADANDLIARYDGNRLKINKGYLDEKRRVKALSIRGKKVMD